MTIDIERLKHDREYWDSEAPVGATHYGTGELDDCPWMMAIQGRSGRAWTAWDGRVWIPMAIVEDYEDMLIPRPSPTWNGEGLPPVGVECELLWGGVSQGVVEIIQYRGWKAIFWRKEKDHVDSAELPTAAFRPLKTEKERVVEAALIELSLVAGFHDRDREVAEALYDAGMLKEPTND